jgi:DNA-binding HxlR family transcriptional regulator
VSKHYDQYCPIAHALGLVGERWSLLIVRELLSGPKRYTDLAASLPGIGTNVLAARLKELEAGGLLTKHRLPPPAASQVYELTPYGHELRPAMRALALWGLRSMDAPTDEGDFAPDWLYSALDTVFAPVALPGSFEFRVGKETAALVDGEPRRGSIADPDVVVECDVVPFHALFMQRCWDGVTVEGDRDLLERLLDAATAPAPAVPA